MNIELIDFKQDFRIKQVIRDDGEFTRNVPGLYRLNENLMVFPFAGRIKILFSFLLGKAFKISIDDYRKYIAKFSNIRFFPKILLDQGIVVRRKETRDKAFFDPPPQMFRDLVLNMVPTCNLRCRYCYASSGRRGETKIMDLAMAKKAVDYVSRYCGDELNLNIVGEGEPTLVLDLFKKILAYAKRKIKKVRVNPLSTNGVITAKAAGWLARNIDELQISCDGPDFIQNKYRPLASGGKSSQAVGGTISYLVGQKKDFRVRATITDDTFGKEKQVINYFFQLGVKRLAFGTLENIGSTAGMVRLKKFKQNKIFERKNYLKELLVLAELEDEVGMRDYDPYLPRIGTTVTCGIYTKSLFVLDPQGTVSVCARHTSPYDFEEYPFLRDFVIGFYNRDKGRFDIDLDKLEWFRETIRATLKANACASCSQAPACGSVCLYQIARRRGKFFPVRRHCDEVDKKFPASTFEYIADRYLVSKVPCLEVRGRQWWYCLKYNDFLLSPQKGNGKMRHNPYIYINSVKELAGLKKRIVAYKNKRKELTLFLLKFNLDPRYVTPGNGGKILRFFSDLRNNHVYFRLSSPLPVSLFGSDYAAVCVEYRLPASHKESTELYVRQGKTIRFANGQAGSRNWESYSDREEIYRDFLAHQKS